MKNKKTKNPAQYLKKAYDDAFKKEMDFQAAERSRRATEAQMKRFPKVEKPKKSTYSVKEILAGIPGHNNKF